MNDWLSFLARTGLVLLEPIGLIWLCLLGLAVALWRKRLRRLSLVPGALAVFIYLIGSTDFPGALLRSLERQYVVADLAALPKTDAVVMLGGGLQASRYEVANLHLTKAGDRIVMALEMIRLGKAPVLVCGGAGSEMDGQAWKEADLFKAALEERRVPVPEIVSLGQCANTHDEALRTRALAKERGWKRVMLVSSANHLPRAAATFRSAGLEIVPVPCNFLTTLSTAPAPPSLAAPSVGGFEKISIWLHERIGWWEYRRRGWITAEQADPPASAPGAL